MAEQQGLLEMLDVVSTPADDSMGTPMMAPQDGRCGELRAGLDLCQESAISLPQIGFIMDGQTHAEQLSTVPLLRLRFQRLVLHTIHYCSSCFLPARGLKLTLTYAKGLNRLNGLTESIYWVYNLWVYRTGS